jgi:hypothetical protein
MTVRLVAMGAVFVALLLGTWRGQDDHFPFGPFRMYSTTDPPSGQITKIGFVGVTEDGREITIRSGQFGMRPAEVDGQIARMRRSPDLVAHLVTAYERFNPDQPRLDGFEIVYGIHQLQDRTPVAYEEKVIARWQR